MIQAAITRPLAIFAQVQHNRQNNTASGSASLKENTTGENNTATGYWSLRFNTTGGDNTASGNISLPSNTTGEANTASGAASLYSNTTGNDNTASGSDALYANNTGNNNTASGSAALYSNTTGNNNAASGSNSLYSNTTGVENTAVGSSALYSSTTATNNTAVGNWALYGATTGGYNTAMGSSALSSNTSGSGNVALGNASLYANTTGTNNTAIGELAGFSNSTGTGNVFIGRAAGFYETLGNRLYISNNATTPLLYGVFNATASNNKLGIGTATVAAGDAIKVWNGARLTTGGVWTNASSRELKDNIKTLSTDDANKALAGLSPVRYVYKNSDDEEYMGFIAEDVPDLVAMNDHKSLSPMDIVAVLTTVTKEQTAKMTEKDSEIAALRDSLAKQDERMLQMELALTEILHHQAHEVQVSSSN